MALISLGVNHDPQYLALSSDIVSSTIAGLSLVGAKVYLTDTGVTKIVKNDLTLADYTIATSSSGGGSSVVTNAGTFAVQETGSLLTLTGAVTETAPVTDTASSGINGRLQRIAQRLTSLIALLPTALGANGGLKIEGVASGTVVPVSGVLTAGSASIGKIITPTFSASDSLTRPANTTAYAINQSINCNVSVTAMSYSGLTVTLTAANAFAVGDKITVAGVNSGFTVTNIDGNWTCKTGTNSTTIVFDVLIQPTGTTPQTITVGTIAKNLSVTVADANGNGIILSRISVSMQGVAMTGAIRAYLYTTQQTCLVDQSTFTLLSTNDGSRRDYFDLYPVTEGSGSNVTFSSVRLWEVIKCDPSDTKLYFRLVIEAASTPISSGVITIRVSGVQLGG